MRRRKREQREETNNFRWFARTIVNSFVCFFFSSFFVALFHVFARHRPVIKTVNSYVFVFGNINSNTEHTHTHTSTQCSIFDLTILRFFIHLFSVYIHNMPPQPSPSFIVPYTRWLSLLKCYYSFVSSLLFKRFTANPTVNTLSFSLCVPSIEYGKTASNTIEMVEIINDNWMYWNVK